MNRTSFGIFIISFLLWISCFCPDGFADETPAAKVPVTIEYFFQPGCAECEMINKNVIPELEERYKSLYHIKKYDTGIKDNFLLLAAYQDKLKMNKNKPVYMVLNGQYILAGYKQISSGIYDIIDTIISSENAIGKSEPASAVPIEKDILRSKADSFKIGTIVIAGLIDGINPCVFSTLVFFLSLLLVSGVRGSKLLIVGSIYCAACFVTYLAIGIGIFRALKLFTGYQYLQNSVNMAMALLLIIFAFLSFRDALRYKVSGESSSIMLKLPAALQSRIHSIMRKGLSYKYLIPSIFFIGIFVTVIESVCTGQVYVPTLVFMTGDAGLFSRWFLYLLLYNLMFIVPLLIVFIIAWRGMKTFELIRWSRKNLVFAKILLGLFFIGMAILLFLL